MLGKGRGEGGRGIVLVHAQSHTKVASHLLVCEGDFTVTFV